MIAEQLSLTAVPVTRGTHRKGDPSTSTEAAKAKDPGPDVERTVIALRRNGGEGTIDTVCAYFAAIGIGRDRGALSRRLTDAETGGYIRKTTRTVTGSRGRSVLVWEVLPHG